MSTTYVLFKKADADLDVTEGSGKFELNVTIHRATRGLDPIQVHVFDDLNAEDLKEIVRKLTEVIGYFDDGWHPGRTP